MIPKITSRLTPIVKQPVRATLQKATVAGMALLAGSSMSNCHGPHFEPTDMIIPGGLDFKEKAYYLLKGKLPPSVYERWFPKTDDYVASQDDQTVTVNIADGRYIGSIVESPHDIETIASHEELIGSGQDVSGDAMNSLGEDSGISDFEIWEHLSGF